MDATPDQLDPLVGHRPIWRDRCICFTSANQAMIGLINRVVAAGCLSSVVMSTSAMQLMQPGGLPVTEKR
jgi:hypothetical protein